MLDVACGEGFYTRMIRERGAARVTGIDLSQGMIDLARKQEAQHRLVPGRRKGIGEGWLTLHPQGAPHGPQPGAAETAGTKEIANELAVMIECRNPLTVTDDAKVAEDPAYTTSWARGLGLID